MKSPVVSPDVADLATLLREALTSRMRDQGVTAADLGRRCGVSASTVRNLLHGKVGGMLSTWSLVLHHLDRQSLVSAAGALSPSALTRPVNPRLLDGDTVVDLTYAMHDVGVRDGVRVFEIELGRSQMEAVVAGRAHLELDRVLDRTGIAFSVVDDFDEQPALDEDQDDEDQDDDGQADQERADEQADEQADASQELQLLPLGSAW